MCYFLQARKINEYLPACFSHWNRTNINYCLYPYVHCNSPGSTFDPPDYGQLKGPHISLYCTYGYNGLVKGVTLHNTTNTHTQKGWERGCHSSLDFHTLRCTNAHTYIQYTHSVIQCIHTLSVTDMYQSVSHRYHLHRKLRCIQAFYPILSHAQAYSGHTCSSHRKWK